MTRILLAEDEQAMREYLPRAPERSGYDVVAVGRGTAAAPLLEQEHFDLLLTEYCDARNGRHRTRAPLYPRVSGH